MGGGHLEVARNELAVLMRVVDLGNMNISLTLHDFVQASLESGYRHFILDMAACTGMDSTFMGTVVALAKNIRERCGWLCLCNVSEDNRQKLSLLGVSKFVPVKEQLLLQNVEMTRLTPENEAARRLELIRQAHEMLVAIDERNRQRFGPFLAALAKEMEEGGGEEEKRKEESGSSDFIIIGPTDAASPRVPASAGETAAAPKALDNHKLSGG